MKPKVITEESYKRNQKAQKIFDEAENFFMASILLQNSINKNDELKKFGMQNVFNINHAFAVELYLKCLQVIEKGSHEVGHVLIKLFDGLNKHTRKRISTLYNQNWLDMRFGTVFIMEPNGGDFEKLLSEINEPFKAFRYLFENAVELPTYKLENATNCLRAVIFENDELIDPRYTGLF